MNVAVGCAYFAVNGLNEALIGRKYQFSSNMFPPPTTPTMFDSQMGFILRFHETCIVDSTSYKFFSSEKLTECIYKVVFICETLTLDRVQS